MRTWVLTSINFVIYQQNKYSFSRGLNENCCWDFKAIPVACGILFVIRSKVEITLLPKSQNLQIGKHI